MIYITHGSAKIILQKLLSLIAFSLFSSGNPAPISIETIFPAFIDKLVTTPKVPNKFYGTVSSIILARATENTPPEKPRTSLPKQIV